MTGDYLGGIYYLGRSFKRGRLTRCLPSEVFEVLRQVLALAEYTLGKSFKRERQICGESKCGDNRYMADPHPQEYQA
jgi:hypothetical protein